MTQISGSISVKNIRDNDSDDVVLFTVSASLELQTSVFVSCWLRHHLCCFHTFTQ